MERHKLQRWGVFLALYLLTWVGGWLTYPGRLQAEAVAVWELDDYRHLERYARAAYGAGSDGAGLRAWQDRRRRWVQRTEGLVCEPCADSPTVAELAQRGVRAALCTHEVVACAPGRHAEYGRRLHEMWHRRFSLNEEQPKERTVIGLYYAKWSNTIAINIWGDGESWDAVRIWDPDWERDPNFDLWNTLGREIRTDFTDRFLVPVPFSPVR